MHEAHEFGFLSSAVVCGSVLPLRGSRSPGGHRQRLRIPQPQIQPAEEQQEHGLLQGETHAERGERKRARMSRMALLLQIRLFFKKVRLFFLTSHSLCS